MKKSRTRWIDQIGKELRGKNLEEIQKKTGSGRIETAGNFSVIVDPYLWKLLINDDVLHGYLRKCFTRKWREKDQEEDPEPGRLIKLERT